MKAILTVLIVVVLLAPFAYGVWHLKRWFNYSFGYEAEVHSTVCQMVKPEYLKEPC